MTQAFVAEASLEDKLAKRLERLVEIDVSKGLRPGLYSRAIQSATIIKNSLQEMPMASPHRKIRIFEQVPFLFAEIERLRSGVEENFLEPNGPRKQVATAEMHLFQIDRFLSDATAYFKERAEEILPASHPLLHYFTRRVFLSECRETEKNVSGFSSDRNALRQVIGAFVPVNANPIEVHKAAAALTERITVSQAENFGKPNTRLVNIRSMGRCLGLF